MRIHHRPLVNVSSYVHVRWRHYDHRRGYESTAANRRPAGHYPNLVRNGKFVHRKRVLIEKRHSGNAHVGKLSGFEAIQNQFLHVSIHSPLSIGLFRYADFPCFQIPYQFFKFAHDLTFRTSRVAFIISLVCSLASVSGRRICAEQRLKAARPALTGIGLLSTKQLSKRSRSL